MPAFVPEGARYFVTISCEERERNQLCLPEVGAALVASARHYDRIGRWGLFLVVVMPDHLHLVASFDARRGLKQTASSWKSYQAKTLRIAWQAGFFDHRLRDAYEVTEKCSYIRMNPVRAGLVGRAGDWPYAWQRESL